ncbi:probable G-protein coupled receptor 139 [Stegostoma tigrinum]|uniref:probable G-protein coupled receptor 139 n=1 Tax=Stegostoma tigrinum TaxID=3053191 RepID=UPI002870174C|nr:probable G-protein coupled receptor 139 [Stegostoma tigrinum]
MRSQVVLEESQRDCGAEGKLKFHLQPLQNSKRGPQADTLRVNVEGCVAGGLEPDELSKSPVVREGHELRSPAQVADMKLMDLSLIEQTAFIYYHILGIFGVPANILTIVILVRGGCGLSKGITLYLVGMTIVDLLVIIFNVMMYYIFYYYFPFSILHYTSTVSINEVINYVLVDYSVWLTVAFTVDRFVLISCQKLSEKYCREKPAAVIITILGVVSCIKNIPLYFAFEPGYIIDGMEWTVDFKPEYFTWPGWITFDWIDIILNPLLPYFLILLLNTLTVRHIVMANRTRRGLQGQRNTQNSDDPEIQSRRKSIILLFAISGTFIALWMPPVVFFLISRITERHFEPDQYTDPLLIADYVADMFQLLSSCTNTCIYALAQTKFREKLKNACHLAVIQSSGTSPETNDFWKIGTDASNISAATSSRIL